MQMQMQICTLLQTSPHLSHSALLSGFQTKVKFRLDLHIGNASIEKKIKDTIILIGTFLLLFHLLALNFDV